MWVIRVRGGDGLAWWTFVVTTHYLWLDQHSSTWIDTFSCDRYRATLLTRLPNACGRFYMTPIVDGG